MSQAHGEQPVQLGYDTEQHARNVARQMQLMAGRHLETEVELRAELAQRDAVITALVTEREQLRAQLSKAQGGVPESAAAAAG